jgi:hypothetical protein
MQSKPFANGIKTQATQEDFMTRLVPNRQFHSTFSVEIQPPHG